MSKLSKSEYKYRIKFIQENHFNKAEQKYLDEKIRKSNLTYKQLYFRVKNEGMFDWLFNVYAKRLNISMQQLGYSVKEFSRVVDEFNSIVCTCCGMPLTINKIRVLYTKDNKYGIINAKIHKKTNKEIMIQ